MAEHETVEELVEELAAWLAAQAHVWASDDDEALAGHADACVCRACWIRRVERRMRQAVAREIDEAIAAARASNER